MNDELEFLEFFNPFVHNRKGWEQWKLGNRTFREEIHRDVRVVDFVLVLQDKVIGHSIRVEPVEKGGVSGTIFRYPSCLNAAVSLAPTPEQGRPTILYFIPLDEVEFLVPHERHVVECGCPLIGMISHYF